LKVSGQVARAASSQKSPANRGERCYDGFAARQEPFGKIQKSFFRLAAKKQAQQLFVRKLNKRAPEIDQHQETKIRMARDS